MDQMDQAIWDAYNLLHLGPDIERLRKLLVRYDLFSKCREVPGDIVECGVFKGTGLMLWLKLLEIYCPGSAKRVVGFDMFTDFPPPSDTKEAESVRELVSEASFEGVTPESLFKKIEAAGIKKSRCDLIQGDVRETAAAYVGERPGFRISLLHLDLDLDEATFAVLEALYPRVVKGGVVVFDEYAVSHWTESNAVDRFFHNMDVQLATLPWARTPTAFFVKG